MLYAIDSCDEEYHQSQAEYWQTLAGAYEREVTQLRRRLETLLKRGEKPRGRPNVARTNLRLMK